MLLGGKQIPWVLSSCSFSFTQKQLSHPNHTQTTSLLNRRNSHSQSPSHTEIETESRATTAHSIVHTLRTHTHFPPSSLSLSHHQTDTVWCYWRSPAGRRQGSDCLVSQTRTTEWRKTGREIHVEWCHLNNGQLDNPTSIHIITYHCTYLHQMHEPSTGNHGEGLQVWWYCGRGG